MLSLYNVIKVLYFALIFLITTSCKINTVTDSVVKNAPPSVIKYLALGDSYTIGQSVRSSESWPAQLADSLRQKGYIIDRLKIIAKTGWTTSDLQRGIRENNPDSSYNLVSLLIGVNNQHRGYNSVIYRQEFRELLQQSIAFTGGNESHVIVLSIPDYSVTPFGSELEPATIRRQIDLFNAINLDETMKTDAHYFDITSLSREVANDISLLAPDGLHPSAKMYQVWVNLILPVIISTWD